MFLQQNKDELCAAGLASNIRISGLLLEVKAEC